MRRRRRRLLLPLLLALAVLPARSGVREAVETRLLPGLAGFAAAAGALDRAARADCRPAALVPAWHAAFDAWMAVGDMRLGPSETAALSIAFWPDGRGFARRALSGLLARRDGIAGDPAAYAQVSVAARGLMALELLLFDAEFAGGGPDGPECALRRAVAADLAAQAAALATAWRDGFAPLLLSAGAPGNATFLAPEEALRALHTQVLAGLAFTAEQRLGLPLGSPARPRPGLAEAWRSDRSLRNVRLAVDAAEGLAEALAGHALPRTRAAAARVRAAAGGIADPGLRDIADPQARLRVEALQQAVQAMHRAVAAEIGDALGIAPGFNAQDGD